MRFPPDLSPPASVPRGAAAALAFLGLALALCAQEYYVDAETGSNSNSGTLASPWKTVTYALTGPHAPLPQGATVHLLGTATVNYGPASGEAFPWRLYGDIGLVAEPGGSGPNHVVDGSSAWTVIEFDPTRFVANAVLRGLTIVGFENAVEVIPGPGRTHAPVIEGCTILRATRGILLGGEPTSTLAARIRDNTIAECGMAGVAYMPMWPVAVDVVIERNTISVTGPIRGEGVSLMGMMDAGTVVVRQNRVSGCQAGIVVANVATLTLVESNEVWRCTECIAFPDGGYAGLRLIRYNDCHDSLIGLRGTVGVGMEFIGNLIHDNSGVDSVLLLGPGALLLGNEIVGNARTGVRIGAPGARVVGNVVRDNGGDGILDASCDGTWIAGNFVHGNGGRGIVLAQSATGAPPRVTGNTVAYNGGFGILTSLPAGTPPYVGNSIFWGNNGGAGDIAGLAPGQYGHCDIGVGGAPGNGNLSADPLFVSAADLHLQPASPCLDAGHRSWSDWATDADGQPRILDGDWFGGPVPDQGADEVCGVSLALAGSFQAGSVLEAAVTGPAGALVGLFAAAARDRDPVLREAGVFHPFYGTVLLDPALVVSSRPLQWGRIGAGGSAVLRGPVPGGSAVGLRVALQAAVLSPSLLAGQGTNAGSFTILP